MVGPVPRLALLLSLTLSFAQLGCHQLPDIPLPAPQPPAPLLLDLDMGLDDARVLLALPAQRRYRPLLVTTVEGSASARAGAENALRLLASVGLDEVRVARGGPSGFQRAIPPPPWRGLSDTLDGVSLPAARRRLEREPSEQALARALRETSQPRLLALGPLTNLARVLRDDPTLARRIHSLHLLGDFRSCDCYNCRTDPEAARLVLSSRIPTFMVVRAATDRVPFDDRLLARLATLRGPAARLVTRMMGRHGRDGALKLWDDAVLAALLDPPAVPYRRVDPDLPIWQADSLDAERVRELLLQLWDRAIPR